jgi:hypothetical protein
VCHSVCSSGQGSWSGKGFNWSCKSITFIYFEHLDKTVFTDYRRFLFSIVLIYFPSHYQSLKRSTEVVAFFKN